MKVLLANKFFSEKTGTEIRFFGLRRLLKNRGHEVVDFSMKRRGNKSSKYARYFVNNIDYAHDTSITNRFGQIAKMLYSFEARMKMGKLVRRTKPDIAHLHNIYNHISYSVVDELKKHHIPVVMTLHDYRFISGNYYLFDGKKICEGCITGNKLICIKNKCFKNSFVATIAVSLVDLFEKKLLRIKNKIDMFIVPSLFMKKLLIDKGISAKRIEYIPHMISIPKHVRITKGRFVVYAGRISEEKGIRVLLDAFKDLQDIPLKIVGSGPLSEWVAKTIKEQGMGNVTLLGFQERNKLYELIQRARCVVVPSLNYENTPFAILEAYAYGKPVVASRIGSIPEIVQHGATGLLFKAGSASGLGEAIKKIYLSNTKKMGRQGHLFVRSHFSEKQYYQRLKGAYSKLLAMKKLSQSK